MKINTKRIYEKPEPSDGIRVLVDRLWPRGISKENANVKEWIKEISPSLDLIKWFNHESKKWNEFKRKYKKQLQEKTELLVKLKKISQKNTLTLIYSAKDEAHNNALVLKEYLEEFNLK